MKALTKSFAVLSSLSVMFLGNYALAQQSGMFEAGMFEASSYIGQWVASSDGRNLGQISNLVIDRANGRVVLVVLSDVSGLGTKAVAVPFVSVARIGGRLILSNYGLNEIWVRILTAEAYLNELKKDSILVGLPSVIDPQWVYKIYLRYDQVPYWKEEGRSQKPLSEKELCSLNKLMKSQTRSLEGKTETRIIDLIIDASAGRVAFLILSRVSRSGDTKIAVPFSALAMKDDNTFVVDITENMLAEAPIFGDKEKIDLEWASNVYKYFGLRPYWTEEER